MATRSPRDQPPRGRHCGDLRTAPGTNGSKTRTLSLNAESWFIQRVVNTKKKNTVVVPVKSGPKRRLVKVKVPTPVVRKAVRHVVRSEEKTFGTRLANNFAKPGIGKTIGDFIVPGVGGALGHAAESLFRTIFGQGEYLYSDTVKDAVSNNTILGVQTPAVTQMVDQMHWSGLATRIAHREYIGTINMSAGFSATRLVINPTDPIVFPWLNTISNKFMKYKVLGAAIEYVPTSANAVASGTPAMGSVSIAVQYDEYVPAPLYLQEMLNWQGSVTGRPTDNLVCGVECDGGYTPVNPLYIRHPLQPKGPDNRLYDFAEFIVATEGPASYIGAGQLWITYDLLLIGAYVGLTAPQRPLVSAAPVPTNNTVVDEDLSLSSLHISKSVEKECNCAKR